MTCSDEIAQLLGWLGSHAWTLFLAYVGILFVRQILKPTAELLGSMVGTWILMLVTRTVARVRGKSTST